MDGTNFLGETGKHDILGVLNGFRKLSELYINQLVSQGKWFTVCHKIDKNQEDIMAIKNNGGIKLGSMIDEVFQEGGYRTSIYKYLLMNYLCYIEVPTVSFKSDTGGFKNTFNKILATSNIEVIAEWLGTTVDDLPDKYKARVFSINMDDGEDELPYVKLTETKEGVRKATCPRSDIDVSERGTRVVPLFMLKAGVDTLYSKLADKVVKVTFLKDGGQVRDIFTTVNFNIIKDIYGIGTFYDDSVMMTYDGDFLRNKTLARGYIRVPEIGGSKYDTLTRSINYARIIGINYEEEPDLSFINIDLSTVLEGFQDGVLKHSSKAKDIISMLEAFDLDGGFWRDVKDGGSGRFLSKDSTSLLQWSDENALLLSTVFTRDLCLFMLSNPQWFGDFTGEPKNTFSGYGDVGLE